MERSFQSTRETLHRRRQSTRARVIAAASDLFAASGFAGTSISQIRKSSGASASSIYYEFGNKDGILRAVLEETSDRWMAQFEESSRKAWNETRVSGRPLLEVSFAHLAAEFSERPEFLRLMLLLALERREAEPATIELIRRVRARATSGFARAFREAALVGADVSEELLDDIATATVAFADGAFIAAQTDPDRVDLRRLFSIFYSGLIAALQVEGPARRTESTDRFEGERV